MTTDVGAAFPAGFLWGVATSAFQIEGSTSADGRGETVWDRFVRRPWMIVDGSDGDVACDHYRRMPEDVELLRWLGVGAYRFSIAWARVQPTGSGPVNGPGLDFYERLVDRLLASGIQPFVTLNHWDLPQALEDAGGWGVRETADRFADYAGLVFDRLGDRVAGWITHNEPWCQAFLGHATGHHAPGRCDWSRAYQVAHHLFVGHGLPSNGSVPRRRPAPSAWRSTRSSTSPPAIDRPTWRRATGSRPMPSISSSTPSSTVATRPRSWTGSGHMLHVSPPTS